MTSSVISAFISKGTPGSDTTTRSSSSNHIPEAVPNLFSNTFAFAGSKACFRFSSLMGVGTYLRNISSIRSNTTSFLTSSSSKYSQRVCLVKSSLVGPKPPVKMMTCARCLAASRQAMISSFLSEIEVICLTSIPTLFNSFAIKTALVLTIWPMRISSPMLTISAYIILLWY